MIHVFKQCPFCGSGVSFYTRRHQHVNGHWNEDVGYDCGNGQKFSPNFMSTKISNQCRKDGAEKQAEKETKIIMDKLHDVVIDHEHLQEAVESLRREIGRQILDSLRPQLPWVPVKHSTNM